MKVNLRHVASILLLDMYTNIFLFPKKHWSLRPLNITESDYASDYLPVLSVFISSFLVFTFSHNNVFSTAIIDVAEFATILGEIDPLFRVSCTAKAFLVSEQL